MTIAIVLLLLVVGPVLSSPVSNKKSGTSFLDVEAYILAVAFRVQYKDDESPAPPKWAGACRRTFGRFFVTPIRGNNLRCS